jgi:hypothetical protein
VKRKIINALLIVIFLIFSGIVLVRTYRLSQEANRIVEDGDRLIGLQQPKKALERYEEASGMFPLIKYTSSFKRRVVYAEAAVAAYAKTPSVIIYFNEEVADSDIQTLTSEISDIKGYVDSIYVPKDEALVKYKEQITGDEADNLFNSISEDDLMSYMEVYLADASYNDEIKQIATQKDFVFDTVSVSR